MNMYDAKYMIEAEFLKESQDYINAQPDAFVTRVIKGSVDGIADLLICCNGKFIAAELKRFDGVASANQEKYIAKIKKAGGLALVCYTMNDIIKLLTEARKT